MEEPAEHPRLSRRTFTLGVLSAGILGSPLVQAAGTFINPVAEPEQNATGPTDKFVIYQIFTRLFGNQNITNKPWGSRDENGVGKFNDITAKALGEIKKLGITHVWYTGVIEHATMTDYSAVGIRRDNPLVVKGRAGSPYAIKDYYDVDPDLAVDVKNRMREFEALVQRTHANGLKVIIDFVPNHVAREYHSDAKPAGVADMGQTDNTTQAFGPQNNFYYLPNELFEAPDGVYVPDGVVQTPYVEKPAKATGNDVFKAKPKLDDWYETIKLNYGVDYQNGRKNHFEPVPSTWTKMRDILRFWARKGVDGFRCDVAEMVPVEFWAWAIPQVKAVRKSGEPPITFIAEAYDPRQYKPFIKTGGFDYLYDKVGLYDVVRQLMEGKGTARDISKVVQREGGTLENHMLRFLENHDEQRVASRSFAGDPWTAVPAMTLSVTLNTGPIMLYFGQELGVNPTQAEGFQGDDGRTTIFDYWGVPEYQAWTNGGAFDGGKLTDNQRKLRQFYQQLNQLVLTSDAIRTGRFYDLQTGDAQGKSAGYDPDRLFSFLRHSGKQRLLIVGNFDKQKTAKTSVQISPEAWQAMQLDGSRTFTFRDIFRTKMKFTARARVPIELAPLGVLVLEIT